MAKKRNPSFEILRVVAMFLIVVWHFLMHGVGQKPDGITSDIPSLFNLCSMEMIGCLAKVSTNCYILITGYFIIHQTSPKWEKIPKTWAPIVFYSVLLFFVFLLCSNLRLGWDDFGKSFMPIYFNHEGVNHFGKLYFLVAIVLAAIFLVKTFVHYGVWSSPMMADYHDNNGILFIAALMLFLWTARYKAPDTWLVRFLVRIAPLTFGVYLIHDNIYVRRLLWHDWLDVHSWLHSWAFVPMLVASTLGIFFACIAIDSVRDRLFRLLRVNDRIDTLFAKIKPKNNAI